LHSDSVINDDEARLLDSANRLDLAAECGQFSQTAAGIIAQDDKRSAEILRNRAGLAVMAYTGGGGYGISTENTAYRNLRAGIEAPRSGSIAQNGAAVAEHIGGQIFIDSWGWVNPGNPTRAADMSAVAASVAHDGDGLNGARFVAAMIAAAFTARTVDDRFKAGNAAIEPKSEYARVVTAVQKFHAKNPDDWRACRKFLTTKFGYDRYPGVCHIIPNTGVMVLAMLYGQGELTRTVEIATMCGWDTDCNAGNAGAIIGTFQGAQPSWDKYRKPINDFLVASGMVGTLNVSSDSNWDEISFTIPDMDGEAVNKIGLEIEYFGRLKFLGHLYIGNSEVSGHSRIDPASEVEEWGAIS